MLHTHISHDILYRAHFDNFFPCIFRISTLSFSTRQIWVLYEPFIRDATLTNQLAKLLSNSHAPVYLGSFLARRLINLRNRGKIRQDLIGFLSESVNSAVRCARMSLGLRVPVFLVRVNEGKASEDTRFGGRMCGNDPPGRFVPTLLPREPVAVPGVRRRAAHLSNLP